MDFDSIDEKQAFKLGFAAYCADNSMPVEKAAEFAKQSFIQLAPALPYITAALAAGGTALYNLASGAAKNAPEIGWTSIGIPAAAGMALGGGLGHLAAKSEEPDVTTDDIKAQELQDTYKRYADRLKSRRAYQQYRAARH
jgi:hypothetical protein